MEQQFENDKRTTSSGPSLGLSSAREVTSVQNHERFAIEATSNSLDLQTIHGRTQRCQALFGELLQQVLPSKAPTEVYDWIKIRQGEFNLWVASLRAADHGETSLDHLLRDHPELLHMVCNLLEGLTEALQAYQQTGTSNAWLETLESDASASPEDDHDSVSLFSEFSSNESDYMLSTETAKSKSVVSENKFYIQLIIKQLTRVSTAIIRSVHKLRYKKADESLILDEDELKEFKAELTLVIIRSNGSIKDMQLDELSRVQMGLDEHFNLTRIQKRLIDANITRRKRMMYATRNARNREDPEEQTASDPTPSTMTGAKKTCDNQDHPECPNPQHGNLARCPDCTELLDESYLSHNSIWRGHVARDILPYSCIYEDCKSPDTLYHTYAELRQHIMAENGVPEWVCIPCASKSGDNGQFIFKKRDDWQSHMQISHEEGGYSELNESFETEGQQSYASIAATLMASCKQLKQENPIAGDLLSFMSVLNRFEIPWIFVSKFYHHHYNDEHGSSAIRDGLDILIGFGFLAENKTVPERESRIDQSVEPCFNMPWFIQRAVTSWLRDRGRREEFEYQALRIVSESFPSGKEFENWRLCREYYYHAREVRSFISVSSQYEVERGTFLNNFGGYLQGIGRWDEAEKAYQDAAIIRRRILGEEHPDTLTTLADLASVYLDQGKLQEADELAYAVNKSRAKVLGETHADTLMSRDNRARILRMQGRIPEAVLLERKTLVECRGHLGFEHPQTLTVRANLASALRIQGRYSDAERLGTEVLAQKRRILGEQHPNTLSSISSLASVLLCRGRLEDAETLGTEVLRLRRSVLGKEHPATLVSMNNLASIYWHRKRYAEAERVGKEALQLQSKRIGESHPDTLTTAAIMASIYSGQRRFREAAQLGSTILESREKVLGREHPDTWTSMNNLASTQMHLREFERARELSLRVFELRRKVLGKHHPSTLSSMNTLAHAQYKLGQKAIAIKLMQDCVGYRRVVLGEEDPRTLMSMHNLEYWQDD
ncbi:unnamed protein product [Clonostachys solani]|uniref:Nephrocystin-3 n=1 Tax=Clonostachys solani TaxID=160281 RepID=A0A9N9ZED0_9HYPO|nr:unnamed protein product [Clonostachys solani]